MCIINDTAGSFLRWLTGIQTVDYNTELFLAMFEEKQNLIKILFYPHVCAVHCKWLVLYMVKPHYKVTFYTPFIFKLLYMYMYEVAGREIHLDH